MNRLLYLALKLADREPVEYRYPRPEIEIPSAVRQRLIRDNADEPLFDTVRRRFRRGRPGVSREDEIWWIVRDAGGRVVGGLRVVDIAPDHPPGLDVAVDPRRVRQGFASALYVAAERDGIDVDAGSSASLAHRSMTALGYAFMLARRRRRDAEAAETIAASAHICPGCGPLE